jgi:UPF0755 protein
MRLRSKAVVAAGLLAILLILSITALLYTAPDLENDTSTKILVKPGDTAAAIAQSLHRNKLVSSPFLFRLAVKILGKERSLIAGTYRIQGRPRIGSLIRILTEGRVATVKVTIPEGATLSRVGRILEEEGVISFGEFVSAATNPELAQKAGLPGKTFEGFLFPDTYEFAEGSAAWDILSRMTRNFFDRLTTLGGGNPPPVSELLNLVTLASIIEREYRMPQEAPLMASVFQNRLKLGMPLQSCATVVYILTEKLGKPHPQVVYYADLEIVDPYNTYRNRGLPPGPIANPGIVSLKAALNAPKSKYLYFRLEDPATGSHKFSSNFDEHRQESIPVKGY